MLILPAIDIRAGRCVRLFQGSFDRETVYADDPVTVAKRFESEGAAWIHVVDLDGALAGSPVHIDLIGKIAGSVACRIQAGGGVRSIDSAKKLLAVGVERVVIGTRLVQSPEEAGSIFTELGQLAVAGIDARSGRVATDGWTAETNVDVMALAQRAAELGASRIVLTDIGRDGTLAGPNLSLLNRVLRSVSVHVIASGGVGDIQHIHMLRATAANNLEGVIVGRALYEGKLSLAEALRESESSTDGPSYEGSSL